MVRGFFLMTCVLLALSVPYNVQAADSVTVNETTLKSTLKDAMAEGRSSSRGVSGTVIGHLLAAQTRMQNQIADCASSSSVSSMKADLEKTTSDLQKTTSDLQKTKMKLQKTEEKLQAAMNSPLKSDPGSTFVRWGRKTCPATTTMVYSGVAGGKHYIQKGSGNNRLCLTRSPQFDNTPVPSHYGYLYGGEYEVIGNHHNHDVPCSVCRAPQSTTIMMAATLTCPPGWTAQYTGYLTSEYKDHYAAEYVCLDGNPENDYSGGLKDDNGLLFYHVITVCGSLPCPPYKNNKIVTCVVCSSSSGGVSGAVIGHLLAAQTRMQNQIADCASSSSVSSMKADLEKTTSDLQKTKMKLQKTEEKLQAAMNSTLKSDPGSTFVRWGRKTCPANTTMVYSGVAGGKYHNQKGSGNNRLCLTRSPQFDNTPVPKYYGYLYGGEYEEIGNHLNHDVPCSVCRAPQSTTIMMAATLTCPQGWTAQYTGYLTSEYKDHYAAEYVCLDGNPENDYSGGLKNEDGLLFYHVITVCGSLPCPPYKNNKVVTCVVCSR